jgi:hypothetical protein
LPQSEKRRTILTKVNCLQDWAIQESNKNANLDKKLKPMRPKAWKNKVNRKMAENSDDEHALFEHNSIRGLIKKALKVYID